MDEKLANLLGLLLSDGSVYYDKSKRTYCIQFTNKSPTLLKLFKELMKECFGVEKFYEIKCSNATSLRVFSKKIADELFKYSPTFRTLPLQQFPRAKKNSVPGGDKPLMYDSIEYPPCKIPNEVFNDKRYVSAFLRGFTSGDGSVYTNKRYGIYRFEITCYHPFLREQILKGLSLLEIPASQRRNSVYVSGIQNYRKFKADVGFVK